MSTATGHRPKLPKQFVDLTLDATSASESESRVASPRNRQRTNSTTYARSLQPSNLTSTTSHHEPPDLAISYTNPTTDPQAPRFPSTQSPRKKRRVIDSDDTTDEGDGPRPKQMQSSAKAASITAQPPLPPKIMPAARHSQNNGNSASRPYSPSSHVKFPSSSHWHMRKHPLYGPSTTTPTHSAPHVGIGKVHDLAMSWSSFGPVPTDMHNVRLISQPAASFKPLAPRYVVPTSLATHRVIYPTPASSAPAPSSDHSHSPPTHRIPSMPVLLSNHTRTEPTPHSNSDHQGHTNVKPNAPVNTFDNVSNHTAPNSVTPGPKHQSPTSTKSNLTPSSSGRTEHPSKVFHPELSSKLAVNSRSEPQSTPDLRSPLPTVITQDPNTVTPVRQAAVDYLARFSSLSPSERTKALVAVVQRTPYSRENSWTTEENALLIHVKEELQVKWKDIYQNYLKHRGSAWHVCQAQYSHHLAVRVRPKLGGPLLHLGASLSRSDAEDSSGPDAVQPQGSRFPSRKRQILRSTAADREIHRNFEGQTSDQMDEFAEDSSGDHVDGLRRPTQSKYSTSAKLPSSLIPARSRRSKNQPMLLKEAECRSRTAAALASVLKQIEPPSLLPSMVARSSLSGIPLAGKSKLRSRPFVKVQRPYLRFQQRQFLKKSIESSLWHCGATEWQNQVLHVDFTDLEVRCLSSFIIEVMRNDGVPLPFNVDMAEDAIQTLSPIALRDCLSGLLKPANSKQLNKIVRGAQNNNGIANRTLDSLCAFLEDLKDKKLNQTCISYRIDHTPRSHSLSPVSRSSELRRRELGGSRIPTRISANLLAIQEDSMGPCLSFTGCSGDVNAVAWGPDDDHFAVASAALTDNHSMQYNTTNNLLFGCLTRKSLFELPHHATKRPRTKMGPNASESMYTSQDPLLFQSVSAVQFTSEGDAMISTGYDSYTRVWDLRQKEIGPVCKWSIPHEAEVDVLAINPRGLFASGCKTLHEKSVCILKYNLDAEDITALKVASFNAPQSAGSSPKHIYPSCLRWGSTVHDQERYLLCGFSSNIDFCAEGKFCLWDVEASQPAAVAKGSRSVFDIAWSPSTFGRFAVGSTRGLSANRGTNSIVALWDSRKMPSNITSTMNVSHGRTCELECPARDMNEVIFNPTDEFMISVGCTDGSTYIWDLRNPDEILHKLSHGSAATELDQSANREDVDTGVRFLSWGSTRRSMYTGSSDGIVAHWDPYRSSEDAFLRQVVQLNSGIMSGSFSSDYLNLLLGEVNGSVTMMSVDQEDKTISDCERFELTPASGATLNEVLVPLGLPSVGISQPEAISTPIGQDLVDSGQIEIRPFGDLPFRQAVQGPKYNGPYDLSEESNLLRLEAEGFQDKFKKCEKSPGSSNDVIHITEEEKGDSKFWKSRIPHNIRTTAGNALPRDPNLTCLRCTSTLQMLDKVDQIVWCSECDLCWRLDVLGYTLISRSNTRPSRNHEKSFGAHESEPHSAEDPDLTLLDLLEQEQAELQNVEDYYHGLWDTNPTF